MTASEPPAKWGADSGGVDEVMCRVDEGRAAAAHRRRRGNQGKEKWNSKMGPSGSGAATRRTRGTMNTVLFRNIGGMK